MKIAYITDHVLPRRSTDSLQTASMVDAFAGLGAKVTLVQPRSWLGGQRTAAEIADYYQIEPRFAVESRRSLFPSIRGIEKLAHAAVSTVSKSVIEADVVYTRNLPSVVASLLRAERPTVYETYRPWPIQRRASRRFFRWVGGKEAFLGAVLHSEYARQSYEGVGIPAEKLLTAYNGIPDEFVERWIPPEEAREAIGLPSNVQIVVYAGTVDVRKGLPEMISLARALPDVLFVLVGYTGRGASRAVDVPPNVRFIAWKPQRDVFVYLCAADVLLIPPTSAPLRKIGNTVLPIKTFSYLAAGRAILAPRTEDLVELLVDGTNAVLVQPDSMPEATERLRTLLADAPLRQRLGNNARSQAEGMTWSNRARQVLDFIEGRLHAMGRRTL